MNLRQVRRVTLCAALIALCVAGAGLFPTQPVAGQEAKPTTLHGAAALDRLKRDGQYESLQAAMDQARLSVNRAAHTPLGRAAWYAPNQSAGYDAYVTEAGVSIAVNDGSYVSLSLHSLGYGQALRAVAPGRVSGDKQTINIEREALREWFVNGADGLEHGFTLDEPPGARQGVPLRLALAVSQGWQAVASDDGKRITLRDAGDGVVEYSKLVVRDRLGRNIKARLAVADEQIVIEVEDGDAAYPLTIDPLFTLQQRLTANDGAVGDHLGYAVALDGDTALIGALYEEGAETDQGAAYVFVRNGNTWTQQAKLFVPDGASNDFFGAAVALSGDTALIGAPGADGGKGAAYVFVRNGTAQGAVWTRQQKLSASGGFAGAQFGAALVLDGQTALVGAPQQTITPSFAVTGAAYVFVRNGATWTQQQRLLANDAEDNDRFGFSVALDADTALVGAPSNTVTVSNQGAAYIFTRTGASWTQQPRLTSNQPAANDQFGNAVALSGERALIGAYLYGSDDRGTVYTFKHRATGWTQTDRTEAPNPTAGANFGVSVAMSGDTMVVGASLGLTTQGVDQRSAYVFVGGGDWALIRQLGPELGAANDRFGFAVALDGDTVLVGAYLSRVTATAQGAAYAFVLHDSRHVEQQKLFANDGAADDYFGGAVALDGNTVVVGADADDLGTNVDQGAAYVFTRTGTAWMFQQKLTANDGTAQDYFGGAVALSGDTLVVGASGDDVGTNANQVVDQGAAYVFTRTGTAWTFQQKLTANDGARDDNFGHAVALSGDIVAVGAYRDDVNTNAGQVVDQGSAYVFTRNGATWTQQPKLTANDGNTESYFGSAVALDGDTLVVGASGANIGGNDDQGSVYVFTRAGTIWSFRQKLTANDGGPRGYFGVAVALSGSILVVGASGDTIGTNNNQGSAYVFTRLGGWRFQQKLTASDGGSGDRFGGEVAISGDTLLVGARGDNIGTNADQGSAYVFVSPACPALTLNPDSLPGGQLGALYDQQLNASGGGAGEEFQFTVSSGVLPPGLTLSYGEGRLTGTPTATGTYRFTVTARSTLSRCPASRSYTLTITPPCPPLSLNPAQLPNGVQGTAYNQMLTAAGGQTPYRYSVTAGALPGGLSLSNTGTLAGTPTASGSFNFTVKATDAGGCAMARAYTLIVDGCVYTLSRTSFSFDAISETNNVTVITTDGCAWTAQSNARWITLSDFSGTGFGTVRFTVAANNGPERTGTLTVAGQTVTITQAALPAHTPRIRQLTPNAVRAGANGLNLTVIGTAFTTSQLVQWNGNNCETSLVSDTQLRAVIPATALAQEGTAILRVADTAGGAASNFVKFRVVGQVAHASAASYDTITLAPDSIVAAFGANLATEVRVAESLPLPTELAGATVTVRDSQGTAVLAPLFFVAPNQVNYLMPAGLADGIATVTITNGRGSAIESLTEITAVAPGLFSANASGGGAAAAVVLRIRAGGEQVYEPVARYDAPTQTFVLLPIDLSKTAEQVYLILFGTGIRRRDALEDVTIKLGELELPVTYAGAAPGLAGVDQVNVLLPASLRGRGEQTVVLDVPDKASNGVNLHFQ